MAPAAEVMAESLKAVSLKAPVVPLIANVTAEPVRDPDVIRRLLVEQVTTMVRWRESVLYMVDHGIDTLVELGAGRVLTGLARRINRDLTAMAIQTPADIESLFATL
jgi:[acyl-carrier-protein] S-malonyltransferase